MVSKETADKLKLMITLKKNKLKEENFIGNTYIAFSKVIQKVTIRSKMSSRILGVIHACYAKPKAKRELINYL